ncbi:flippase [bacterium]|nr:flippase [bacterium]
MISTSKNTFYLLVGYIYQKLAALIYFIFLARYLGVTNFGKYNFALSFTALFLVILDFSFALVLTREIARNREKLNVYLGNILFFKVFATIFYFCLLVLLSFVLKFPQETFYLVLLAGVLAVLESFANTFYAVFRGILDMRYESLGLILNKTAVLIVGFTFMALNFPLVLMMLPLVAGGIVYFSNALSFFCRYFGSFPKLIYQSSVFKKLFNLMLPFFGTTVFNQIYLNIGPVLLNFLAAEKYVGYYSAANRIPLAILTSIGGAFAASLYPSFSYWFVRDKSRLALLLKKGIAYLLLFSLPICFGGCVLAKQIINFIYGSDYLPASITLIILLFSLPLQLLDYVLAAFLNAIEKQKLNFKIRMIATFSFITLNIFLIPIFFHSGAALSFLISLILIFVLEFIYLKKFFNFKDKILLKKIFLIFLASLLMGVFVYFLREKLNLIFLVLVGILIYGLLVFVFQIFSLKELKELKVIFFKKSSHL